MISFFAPGWHLHRQACMSPLWRYSRAENPEESLQSHIIYPGSERARRVRRCEEAAGGAAALCWACIQLGAPEMRGCQQ